MKWWKPWTWRRRQNYVTPGVEVTEIDCCTAKPGTAAAIPAFIGVAEKGPQNPPMWIGPSISRIRWWQFWRWYLIPRYRRESRAAWEKFLEVFGQPMSVEEYERHFGSIKGVEQ